MNKLRRIVIAPLGLVILLGPSACEPAKKEPAVERGDPASEEKKSPGETSGLKLLGRGRGRYKVATVENPGVVSVTAVYKGETIPEQSEIPVNINVEHCAHKVKTEDVIVDRENRGLRNVVVAIEGVRSGKPVPEQVTITNRDCTFEPHVSVAVKGMNFKVLNADPFLHTTHPTLGGSDLFNIPLSDQKADYPARPIPRTGLMEINCDVHKWMKAYMVVHDNPYLGVSDAKGSLRIEEVPAGTYEYRAWHEKLGEQKGSVTVEAGKTAELQLTFELQE